MRRDHDRNEPGGADGTEVGRCLEQGDDRLLLRLTDEVESLEAREGTSRHLRSLPSAAGVAGLASNPIVDLVRLT